MCYERIEGPIGGVRSDFHMASLMAAIYEQNRDRKKKSRPFRPKDFMPKWDRKPQSPEEQMNIFRRMAAGMRGKVK